MISPRLRMFAGPNGSGKSTFKKNYFDTHPRWLGVYINPDDIEREVVRDGRLDFDHFKIKANKNKLLHFLSSAPQIVDHGLLNRVKKLSFTSNTLIFNNVELNSYFISAIADFLHASLVKSKTAFSFETVMSHGNKIELLKKAKSGGFRNYLYYVCTDTPEICLNHIAIRVKQGGHDVPHEKVVDRYYRSLNNLLPAIRATNRAFIFNNAGSGGTWIAEIINGKDIETKNSNVPAWFVKYVLDRSDKK